MVKSGTKSRIQFVKSTLNKWYYHPEARPSLSKSGDTVTGSLFDIKHQRHRQTVATLFTVTLLFRLEQDFPSKLYRRLEERSLYIRHPVVCSPSENIAWKSPFVGESNIPFFDAPRMGVCSFH